MDFFDGTRGPSMFWEYFEMLPNEGKTKSKISNDPGYAKAYVEALSDEYIAELSEQDPEEVSPPIEGYTRVNGQLDDIAESVDLLRHTVVSLLGGKKNKSEFKPRKRPESEVQERLRRRIWESEREESQEMFEKFGF